MGASGPTVVCVLGPGRSGTSATTGLLNLVGVDLGSAGGLVDPGPGGPRGFWERRRIIELNDQILRANGGSWRRPPTLDPGWEDAPALDDLRAEARDLLADAFGDSPVWGWKDPRASLTLPFWRQLVPGMRYVVCLRNPVDCATSISPQPGRDHDAGFYYSRRGPRFERALRLWRVYVAGALANTAGQERILVGYDELFDDPLATAGRLARFAALEPPAPGGDVARAVTDFVDPTLRHHSTPAAEVLRDERLPAEVADLYRETERLLNGDASEVGLT